MATSAFQSTDPEAQERLDKISTLLGELNQPLMDSGSKFLFALVFAPNPDRTRAERQSPS